MTVQISEFVRQAAAAYCALKGFHATQTITLGEAKMEATVHVAASGRIHVSYSACHDPLAQLEDELAGEPEFVDDDLAGMSATYDGAHTWIQDPRTGVTLRKVGRVLYSPIRGVAALGELGFLRTLTYDFLVRDEGEGTSEGRTTRIVALRPKQHHRSLLLKEEHFPVRKATVAFDAETLFPARIEIRPSRESAVALFVPPDVPILIQYSHVRLQPPPDARFRVELPSDSKLFVEDLVPVAQVADRLPFPLNLDPFSAAGFAPRSQALIASDDAHARAYVTVSLERKTAGGSAAGLTIRAGNYLSRNMSRRRSKLSEQGEAAELPAQRGRLLDRTERLPAEMQAALQGALIEVGWEDDTGLFWFLLGENVDASELSSIARAVIEGARAPEGHTREADDTAAGAS